MTQSQENSEQLFIQQGRDRWKYMDTYMGISSSIFPRPPVGISWHTKFTDENEAFFGNLIELFAPQQVNVEYKLGNRWFFPVMALKNAAMTDCSIGEEATLSITAETIQFHYFHWLGKPAFWLWRMWQKAKGMFSGTRKRAN